MNAHKIKRYSNRKLYDTELSRYVTLKELAGFIRNQEPIEVHEHDTQQDCTDYVLAMIIVEEVKGGLRGYKPADLIRLIRGDSTAEAAKAS